MVFIPQFYIQQEFIAYQNAQGTWIQLNQAILPIVSSIGTHNYLGNLLKQHIPTEHWASDTFTFVQDIQGLPTHGKFMVSFDLESMFTNIPLEECIDLSVHF